MSELIRELVEEDIPHVRQLLTKAGRSDDFVSIERLGGMTNRSYHVVLKDGEELLVRIPGEGTEEMINRLDERKSTELACRLGIDTELFWFGDDGTKVMRFIRNPKAVDETVMKQKENMTQAAAIFRRLHSCGEDTGVPFEVFDMAALYERIIRSGGVAFYPDYEDVKQTVMTIKAAVDAVQAPVRVPFDGAFMQEYADGRYLRLKKNITAYQNLK